MICDRPKNHADIFVGGFDDINTKIVRNSSNLNRHSYGDNYYAEHDTRDEIKELIDRIPKSREINLIGHSWGGNTAADIVQDIPDRIHTLITIDPVSLFRPKYEVVSNNAKKWININANGKGISRGDLVGAIGRAWNNAPENHVDIFINAPYNHEEFNEMLDYVPTNQQSTQKLLNK